MLKFNNTSEIEPLEGILGQERAIEAMEIGHLVGEVRI